MRAGWSSAIRPAVRTVVFESPLPDDLHDLLDALRQDAAEAGASRG